jgi:ribonuclease Z
MEEVANEKYHSTARQAATIAQKAGARGLVIGHFSARYKVIEELLEEARSVFPNTQLAEDGKVFNIV